MTGGGRRRRSQRSPVAADPISRLRIPELATWSWTSTGALPPSPFIKESFSLSYTAVGAMVLVSNLTSSVIQPGFDYFADRRVRPWNVLLRCCWGYGNSSVGIALNYWTVLGLLVIMGLGIAVFHPKEIRRYRMRQARWATAISWSRWRQRRQSFGPDHDGLRRLWIGRQPGQCCFPP